MLYSFRRKVIIDHTFLSSDVCGSYTVEACLLFPIIFFLLLLIFNYTLFSYDRARIQARMDVIADQAVSYIAYDIEAESGKLNRTQKVKHTVFYHLFSDKSFQERKMNVYGSKLFQKGFYVTKVQSIQVDCDAFNVTITGKAKVQLIGLNFISWFTKDTFYIDMRESQTIFPREEKTRIWNAAFNLGRNIKGVEQVVQKVKEAIGKIR